MIPRERGGAPALHTSAICFRPSGERLDPRGKRVRGERFINRLVTPVDRDRLGAFGVAGDEEDLQPRTDAFGILREIGAVHARHDDIGDEDVDAILLLAEHLERCSAVLSLEDGEAAARQLGHHEAAHRSIVLRQQDDAFAFDDGGGIGRDGGHRRGREIGLARKVNLERRPLVRRAVELNVAAALADDRLHHRQPEAGAAPLILRGEEGLEHAIAHFRRHAEAGVGHHQRDVRPGNDVDVVVAELDIRERDGERAAARHRIARVDHEVHHHLADLLRVGADRRDRAAGTAASGSRDRSGA